MPKNQIASKVGAGAAGGALSVVTMWGLSFAVDVPADVAAAFSTLFMFLAAWLASAEPQLQMPKDEA